jgi:hypothetical protein
LPNRGIGRLASAAQGGLVDHVVVQQRGGVDELDHRSERVAMRVLATQCTADQQQQGRPQALAASEMMYWATSLTNGTSVLKRSAITWSTRCMSG